MAKRPPGNIDEIYQAMVNETDRGCVLVSAAWLEDRLKNSIELLLKQLGLFGNFDPPEDEYKSLMNGLLDGALGRAANRITFCLAIGMVNKNTASALNAVFSLRNDHFAHFAGVSRLTDARVKDQLENFIKAAAAPSEWAERKLYPEQAASAKRRHSKARRDFMNSVLQVSVDIYDGLLRMSKLIASVYQHSLKESSK